MKINSAIFLKGLVGDDSILHDGMKQVAFIGRSNAGKSSLINCITGSRDLARTSSTPGRTQELNVFKINKSHYFIDLPGYGYAKATFEDWTKLNKLIYWYLFESKLNPKIVLLIDSNIGPTPDDLGMLKFLESHGHDVIIVANKVDKIKSSEYHAKFKKINSEITGHKIIPFSSKEKIGVNELLKEF